VHAAITEFLQLNGKNKLGSDLLDALTLTFEGKSYSDIEKSCVQLRRDTFLKKVSLAEVVEGFVLEHADGMSREARQELASILTGLGHSQRRVSSLLGMGRATVKKVTKGDEDES
jgi:hypothetical protein